MYLRTYRSPPKVKFMSFYNVMCEVLGEKDFLPDGEILCEI